MNFDGSMDFFSIKWTLSASLSVPSSMMPGDVHHSCMDDGSCDHTQSPLGNTRLCGTRVVL